MKNTSSDTRRVLAFDLDGTLISCRERHVALAKASLSAQGDYSFHATKYWNAKRSGKNTRDALLAAGIKYPIAAKAAAVWATQIEDDCWLRLDQLYKDSLESISKVVSHGFKAIIITARARTPNLRRQLKNIGLSQRVDHVYTASPFALPSQKVKLLLKTRAYAFIGDTELDADAAERANVIFAGVSCGLRARSWLQENGVSPIFSCTRLAIDWVLKRYYTER